jgi:hypothetical protein
MSSQYRHDLTLRVFYYPGYYAVYSIERQQLISKGLHVVIYQETELFITTAVRTSSLTAIFLYGEVIQRCRLTSKGLDGAIYQERELFITTAVKTSILHD